MRFIKSSDFYVFSENSFVKCFYADDEYWSIFTDPDFTDYPVAVCCCDYGKQYIWIDRVI